MENLLAFLESDWLLFPTRPRVNVINSDQRREFGTKCGVWRTRVKHRGGVSAAAAVGKHDLGRGLSAGDSRDMSVRDGNGIIDCPHQIGMALASSSVGMYCTKGDSIPRSRTTFRTSAK